MTTESMLLRLKRFQTGMKKKMTVEQKDFWQAGYVCAELEAIHPIKKKKED